MIYHVSFIILLFKLLQSVNICRHLGEPVLLFLQICTTLEQHIDLQDHYGTHTEGTHPEI